jgi:hypothetical protein
MYGKPISCTTLSHLSTVSGSLLSKMGELEEAYAQRYAVAKCEKPA